MSSIVPLWTHAMTTLLNDIKYALRQLRKSPGFTLIAVFSLALAIGVNSGVFALINAMFLKPLIPLNPNEVVNVATARAEGDHVYRPFSFDEFSMLRDAHEVFADVAAFRFAAVGVGIDTRDRREMQRRFGYVVSDNYFSLLGAVPAAGRFFLPEESRPNANIPVAVVSGALWDTLGDSREFSPLQIALNGELCTIVGVVPNDFKGDTAVFGPDIWLPLGMATRINEAFGQGRSDRDLADPGYHVLFVIGRLQPRLSLQAAQERVPAIAARLSELATDAADGPRTLEIGKRSRFNMSTEPSSDGPLGLFGMLLLGMAGVVLLVACLNLANMFLARNVTRSQELAVRLALGATRGRVIRILAFEGLVIALIGGAAGLLLSVTGNSLLLYSLKNSSTLSALGFSLTIDAVPDIRIILATLAFCLMATMLFSLGPAWHTTSELSRGTLSLNRSERTSTDRWGRLFSGRHCLLMVQLSFSLVLLFAAGLFFKAAFDAARLDPGFAPEGDLVAEVDYSLLDTDDADIQTSMATLMERLQSLPSVNQVALASHLPFGHITNNLNVSAIKDSPVGSSQHVRARLASVSAHYFDTMGIKLLHGRDFTDLQWHHPKSTPVVIIDERLAESLFSGMNPVDQYLERTHGPQDRASTPMQIIGVVTAHWDKVFEDGAPPRLFFPLAQRPSQHLFMHIRCAENKLATSAAFCHQIRTELQSLDPDIPLVRLAPFSTVLDGNIELWSMRFVSTLFGIFGVIALVLAVVGVYGVKAFAVARRTREMGIRMALGAPARQVQGIFIKQGVIQILISISVGLLLALGTGQLLASMLLRVSPHHPVVLAVAALPLAAAALLACIIPARRAAKINPMEALRYE